MSTQWIQGVCSLAAACLCSYSVYQAAVQMLSLAVVRLKWLTDVRRSAWYLLLVNQTTHSNKGGGGDTGYCDWIGPRETVHRSRLVIGPMERRRDARATYCRCVYVASVLEVACG